MSGNGDQWSLLLPVKRLDLAKSRLDLPAAARAELALAMASDTATAALACGVVHEVLVITDDERATRALAGLGARVVPDQPDAGLNAALRYGAQAAALGRVASVSSDLPALRAADLAVVLARAGEHPTSVVADSSGAGTTLLAALDVAHFAPAFGLDSLAAHVAAGAIDVSAAAAASVRRDVDNLEDLAAAVELGVGSYTQQALAGLEALRLLGVRAVQGTVRQFDPDTRTGDVLLDDGSVLTYGAGAFEPSGLRLLRIGQRVRLRLDEAGTATLITLPSWPT